MAADSCQRRAWRPRSSVARAARSNVPSTCDAALVGGQCWLAALESFVFCFRDTRAKRADGHVLSSASDLLARTPKRKQPGDSLCSLHAYL